jgi:hypothetical protein
MIAMNWVTPVSFRAYGASNGLTTTGTVHFQFISTVPEPTTLTLLAGALACLSHGMRRARRRASRHTPA